MKILFAIQGTGNGHLCRAMEIYPELVKHGEVDVLVSGIQSDVDIPFPVKYKLYGISFIFGRRGGVNVWQTLKRMKLLRFVRDVKKIPVEQYDLVINDFEPVSAWACKFKKVKCVSLSHQYAVIHPDAHRPFSIDIIGKMILKRYAPVTAGYGFHFEKYGANIFTPVISSDIRYIKPLDYDHHYTVYLPAYDDETILRHLTRFEDVKWEVFSKHNKEPFVYDNVSFRKINKEDFIKSMGTSSGVLCGAGFETPAEAIYLEKKLMVIPMRGQYEQQCNAAVLKKMGVPVIKYLGERFYSDIKEWIEWGRPIRKTYWDNTDNIVKKIVNCHS